MDSEDTQAQAVGMLQELGLTEYEAKCFIALTRTATATAKTVSELVDVPRTRVYDAVRVLEAEGLVEVQHTNPKQFRAVPLDEATRTLREQYEERVTTLRESVERLEFVEDADQQPAHEVWSLSGSEAVASRVERLITDTDDELVMVVGSRELLTDRLFDTLSDTRIRLLLGVTSEGAADRVREALPDAEVFVSGLEWLGEPDADVTVGRMLLSDRETILVSSFRPRTGAEQAVFGHGFENGLVVVARRLMSTGLVPGQHG